MKLLIVICFLAIVGISAIEAQKSGKKKASCVKEICPANEKYKCCGSCNQPTCASKGNAICPDVCVKGCYCKKGFVREFGPNGPCIRAKKCPRTIGTLAPSRK